MGEMEVDSLSQYIIDRRKTQKGKSMHKLFLQTPYIYIHTLSGSPWVVHSNGISDTGATDQCRLIHIRETGASTEG